MAPSRATTIELSSVGQWSWGFSGGDGGGSGWCVGGGGVRELGEVLSIWPVSGIMYGTHLFINLTPQSP